MKWLIIFVGFLICFSSGTGYAFQQDGCGTGNCRDCHKLDKAEAKKILKGVVPTVVDVEMSEVPGLWEVTAEQEGRRIPLYIDFSKQYLISGSILKISSRTDVARERFIALNRVDTATIPLADAIVLGNPKAKRQIIVFDDPECRYCRELHPEMKKVIERHPEVSFAIKLFPLAIHPDARRKARTIICEKSAELLEASLKGEEIPHPSCETDQVEKNIGLAQQLGITSTPTLIFPDGRVIPGYKDADAIWKLLNADVAPEAGKAKAPRKDQPAGK